MDPRLELLAHCFNVVTDAAVFHADIRLGLATGANRSKHLDDAETIENQRLVVSDLDMSGAAQSSSHLRADLQVHANLGALPWPIRSLPDLHDALDAGDDDLQLLRLDC